MKALILCGGKGTRLRPYTHTLPKPMLKLGSKPILQYVIENLKKHDIREIAINLSYLGHKIEEHFGDGSDFDVSITYSHETEPLNTAGALVPLKEFFGNESSIVASGDHLTNIDWTKMVESHKQSGAIATIGVKKQPHPMQVGLVEADDNEYVTGFREKPVLEYLINTGMYIFKTEIFGFVEEGKDFGHDVFPELLAKDKKINTYIFDEYWVDVGQIKDYEYLKELIDVIEVVSPEKLFG